MLKRKLVAYLLGFNILVFGISLLISSTIGQSPWDGVNIGVHQLLGISIGNATFLVACILLVISFILKGDVTVFASLITSLIQSVMIDVYLSIVGKMPLEQFYPLKVVYFIGGMLCMALGCAIYIQTSFPTNHVDCFMVSIASRFKLNLKVSKWIADGLALALSFVLIGSITWGSFIVLLCLGPLIHFMSKQVEIPLKSYLGLN